MQLPSTSAARVFLICGMRRSGSTLLATVLCSDLRAHSPRPEAQILTQLVEAYSWSTTNFEHFGRPFLGDHARLREMFAAPCRTFLSDASHVLGANGLLILKSPRMVRMLDAFRDLLPDVRVVLTVRDPRDQVASELDVARRTGRVTEDAVQRSAQTLRDWFAGRPEAKEVLTVRYEDLVCDFPAARARLETELGLDLPFDPDAPWPDLDALTPMRSYPSWGPKYGARLDAGSVGRFRIDLTARQIGEIETTCAELMQRFGYEPVRASS